MRPPIDSFAQSRDLILGNSAAAPYRLPVGVVPNADGQAEEWIASFIKQRLYIIREPVHSFIPTHAAQPASFAITTLCIISNILHFNGERGVLLWQDEA